MSDIPVTVDRAGLWDAEALSDVAAAAFPMACPPELEPTDIETFVADILSGERFGDYLTDPDRTILKATANGDIVGYAMLVAGAPIDPAIAAAIGGRPVAEISKLYVLPGHHGAGVSTALMHAVVDLARRGGYAGVWLGVNQDNERAQRFYAKHGFRTVGTKTTTVGSQVCHDYVLHKEL
ncbi:GNAT family N-acetyltransferase [Nocardia thraciensis]